MKHNLLMYYLRNGVEMVRKNGLRALLDPVGTLSKYSQETAFGNTLSLVKSLDFSSIDLAENARLMERYRTMRDKQVDTANWFIPCFDHVYGGIHSILRFADYFCTKKGVKNRLIIYGNPSASQDEIIDKISNVFPNFKIDEIVVLRNQNLASVPDADICIATLWTSAYLVLKFNRTKGKFYFIQDYEPLAYPAGSLYALAEATYRFGFYGIVNTPGLHEIFVRDYRGIAEYFTPPVDTEIFYPSERALAKPSIEKPLTIFFYARPDRQHNAFELGIATLQKIKQKYGKKVRIYTAGTKWNPTNHEFENTFIDLGALPYRKTASLYRKCDLGIAFSLSKHPSYIPSELMACGCPVVANYNPATTWLLKDRFNCLLTEPSVSCVREKVETLMNDPVLRKKIAKNALDSLPKTSWDSEIEKIYRFISNPHVIERALLGG